jgi:glycosyltransferase involved in cell wall biosynthesis
MIVRDEEAVLARCLASAREVADEIIIVDTGSLDATRDIARGYTDKIYDFAWIDDFAAARNASFSYATKDYVMWLDADDVLLPEDAAKLRKLKETLLPDADTVMMKYNIAFDEQGKPTFSYFRERLLRRGPQAVWEGAIHEVITPFGKILHEDVAVTHRRKEHTDPQRNLKLFERMIASGKVLSPREQFYYARELYYNARYQEAAAMFDRFLDEGKGWIENNIEACRILGQCAAALQDADRTRKALVRSFTYDAPRAELCCEMGYYYFVRQQYPQAMWWYRAALLCSRNDTSGAFTLEDCYGYLPYLQLCVCYDRLGQRDLAVACNEQAGRIRPQSAAYLHNKTYFSGGEDAAGKSSPAGAQRS